MLVGDAANGKPFYSGTTLNQHFLDVLGLIDGAAFHILPIKAAEFKAYADEQKQKRSLEVRLAKSDASSRGSLLSPSPRRSLSPKKSASPRKIESLRKVASSPQDLCGGPRRTLARQSHRAG